MVNNQVRGTILQTISNKSIRRDSITVTSLCANDSTIIAAFRRCGGSSSSSGSGSGSSSTERNYYYSIRAYPLHVTDQEGYIEADVDEKHVITMLGHTSNIHDIQITVANNNNNSNNNGTTLISCSANWTVRLWDVTTGTCWRVVSFENDGVDVVVVGGLSIIGVNRYEFAVLWDTLTDTQLTLHRLFLEGKNDNAANNNNNNNNEEENRERLCLQNPKSRFQCASLYENFVLCGTEDGSIMEFNLTTGEKTCQAIQLLHSAVVAVDYLGGRNRCKHVYVLGYEGEFCLLQRQGQATQHQLKNNSETTHVDTWIIVREIQLNLRGCRSIFYDAPSRTLLVPSSGYLVRVFAFDDPEEEDSE